MKDKNMKKIITLIALFSVAVPTLTESVDDIIALMTRKTREQRCREIVENLIRIFKRSKEEGDRTQAFDSEGAERFRRATFAYLKGELSLEQYQQENAKHLTPEFID